MSTIFIELLFTAACIATGIIIYVVLTTFWNPMQKK